MIVDRGFTCDDVKEITPLKKKEYYTIVRVLSKGSMFWGVLLLVKAVSMLWG